MKNGFEVVDLAPPDFELLVKKLTESGPTPKFKGNWEKQMNRYGKGLVMLSSDQCPYTTKAIKEISQTAEEEYSIPLQIVELKDPEEAQNGLCAFGTFYMLYNGKVIADHPISNTRFKNIMNKILK
jgi:hypothetical protein